MITSKMTEQEIRLDISGLGIIMYSEYTVLKISEGEDYFSTNYQTPQQVAKHINEGTIVGFCTSSPGSFILRFKRECPLENEFNMYEFQISLGIEVRDRKICFRDLYDLMDWRSNCSDSNILELENGFYNITLCGNMPETGILGDNQEIDVYLEKRDTLPSLNYSGVPIFCE